MAGDWIKVEKSTLTKPEIFLIASELGISHEAVVGHCIRFWCWCDDHQEHGTTIIKDTAVIDAIAGIEGFGIAMLNAKWLTLSSDERLVIPKFDRHLGASAKRRASKQQQKQRERAASPKNKAKSKPPKYVSSQNGDTMATSWRQDDDAMCDQRREEEYKDTRFPRLSDIERHGTGRTAKATLRVRLDRRCANSRRQRRQSGGENMKTIAIDCRLDVDAANSVLLMLTENARIERRYGGWYVVWETHRGKLMERRWSTRGQDFYPVWKREWTYGGTTTTALSQLIRWCRHQPVLPLPTWRYWCGEHCRLGRDNGQQIIETLVDAGYPETSDCVLCHNVIVGDMDWWSLTGVTGPCCGWASGCRQRIKPPSERITSGGSRMIRSVESGVDSGGENR